MIGLLRGVPVGDELDSPLLIDVGGVGYELVVPLGTLGRLERSDEGAVTLHVHTHVREDAIELFGFSTPDERTAFRTLIGLPKVGPKLAMSVLSAVTVQELAQLVETKQVGALTRVPGVGKKTAERMILELENKLQPPAKGVRPGSPRVATPAAGQAGVLLAALVRMGFKPAEAERAVASLEDHDRPLSELIRDALAALSP